MNAEELSRSYDISILIRRAAATWLDYIVLFLILLAANLLLGDVL